MRAGLFGDLVVGIAVEPAFAGLGGGDYGVMGVFGVPGGVVVWG